jgi:excisionase family DNA binding protein
VTAPWLEELESAPVVSPKRWADLSGMPRSTVYDQIKNGSLPSIRLGSTIQIPTVPLLKLLGAEAGGES